MWSLMTGGPYIEVQTFITVKPVYKGHSNDQLNVVSLNVSKEVMLVFFVIFIWSLGTSLSGLYAQDVPYMEVIFNTCFTVSVALGPI